MPEGFDPNDLRSCAKVLFGDPIDGIVGTELLYDETTCGIDSIEEVPERTFA